jgi:antitoxin (DNA-binding transcriptional repressor) of toxin-antitoxin stability system
MSNTHSDPDMLDEYDFNKGVTGKYAERFAVASNMEYPMHQIDISEAKTHLAEFIDVALNGEEVVITQDDQPVLKLVRVSPTKPHRKAGSARGLITISDDFDEPLEDFREYTQ